MSGTRLQRFKWFKARTSVGTLDRFVSVTRDISITCTVRRESERCQRRRHWLHFLPVAAAERGRMRAAISLRRATETGERACCEDAVRCIARKRPSAPYRPKRLVPTTLAPLPGRHLASLLPHGGDVRLRCRDAIRPRFCSLSLRVPVAPNDHEEKMAATADATTERGIFQLPRPAWLLDKDVSECMECKAEFTTFNRKVRPRIVRPMSFGWAGAHGWDGRGRLGAGRRETFLRVCSTTAGNGTAAQRTRSLAGSDERPNAELWVPPNRVRGLAAQRPHLLQQVLLAPHDAAAARLRQQGTRV